MKSFVNLLYSSFCRAFRALVFSRSIASLGQKIIKIFNNNDGKVSRSIASLGQNLVKMFKKRIRKLPVLVELSLV